MVTKGMLWICRVRIVNAINSDTFFGRSRSKLELRRIEAERFGMTVGDAKKKLRNTKNKTVKKVAKRSTPDINFEQWQIDLATKIFSKGKP
jgi:hypothetical protein